MIVSDTENMKFCCFFAEYQIGCTKKSQCRKLYVLLWKPKKLKEKFEKEKFEKKSWKISWKKKLKKSWKKVAKTARKKFEKKKFEKTKFEKKVRKNIFFEKKIFDPKKNIRNRKKSQAASPTT